MTDLAKLKRIQELKDSTSPTADQQADLFCAAIDDYASYFSLHDTSPCWLNVCRCIDAGYAVVDFERQHSVLDSLADHYGMTLPWRHKVIERLKASVGATSPLGILLSVLNDQYTIGEGKRFARDVFFPTREMCHGQFLKSADGFAPSVAAFLSSYGHCMSRNYAAYICHRERGRFPDEWMHSDTTWSTDVLVETKSPFASGAREAFLDWKTRVVAAVMTALKQPQLSAIVYDYYMPIMSIHPRCQCDSCAKLDVLYAS